jgi:DNA-binding NarL/FixJ family response regulator
MTERGPGPRIVGRERERRLLDALVSAIRVRGAALVLWGEPGVGKTTLLDYAAGQAEMPVLRAHGVEAEAVLPFATLADLIVPLREYFREIPTVQRDALEVCLALSQDCPTNPYAACAGALNVLAAASEARSLLILVDDLHWVDPSSRRVLLFVARRLSSERVGLVLTVRDEYPDLTIRSDLPCVDVAGLSPDACRQLLRQRGHDVAAPVLDELVELTAGNPLALLETASSLRPSQLRGTEPVGLPPLGRNLEHAWSCRLQDLPDTTRTALAVMAASRSSSITVLASALAAEGHTLAALGPAEQAGLVSVTGDCYQFRHPILRAVVMQRTPLTHRYLAFQALAEVSSGALRTWYRAAAATEPDEEVAQELVQAAREADGRGAFGAAALAWRRAADLTPHAPTRAGRLLAAANDAFLDGSARDAGTWCEEALGLAPDPSLRADLELLRGRARTWAGEPFPAYQGLIRAARAVEATDPERACVLLGEATLPILMDGRVDLALRHAEESVALAGPTRSNSLTLGQVLVMAGRVPEGSGLLDRAIDLFAAADPVADQEPLVLTAQCLAWSDRPEPARRLLTQVIDAGRQRGAPALLPLALGARSELDTWEGRWAAAYADASESLRWAEELGQSGVVGYSLACLARLDAVRGDRARCEEHVDRARRDVGPLGIGCLETYLTSILGVAALSFGEYGDAACQLEQAFGYAERNGLGNPTVVPFAGDLVEAHLRAGNGRRATEVLDGLIGQAHRTGLAWPTAAAHRYQAMLAPDLEQAQSQFAAALAAHRRRETPFEHARTLLCQGEILRRFRQHACAREPLLAAAATFQSLGAAPWARRAAAELAATGPRGVPPAAPAGLLDQLSPQEMQVARAVARGMNNAEAASALFVSRKTVEAHLTRVYRKLGVRSRTDLTRVLVSAGLVD